MDLIAKIRLLEKIPMFTALPSAQLEHLAAGARACQAGRFQFVFMPDEQADFVALLTKGRLKTGTYAEDGREVIKEIYQPFNLVGELALAGESKRLDFAQALHEEVEYLALGVVQVRELMQSNQLLMFSLLQHISRRLQRVEDRMAKLMLKDARKRIIEFLLETAGREGRRVGLETLVKHHLTQQDIANLTGTSRQTVTSVLNDLRKSNLIYFNRNSILIRDIEKLA